MKNRENMCTVAAETKIYWDEDCDSRVIPVVEALVAAMKHRVGYNPIIAASEHEGTLMLIIDKVGKEVPELVDEIPKIVAGICEAIHFDSWTTDMHISDVFPYCTHENEFAPVMDDIESYRERNR